MATTGAFLLEVLPHRDSIENDFPRRTASRAASSVVAGNTDYDVNQ